MNGSGQSDQLSFGVSLSNEWKTAVGTRSAESRQTRYETFRFGDSGLWIISSEEDSISNARLGDRPKTRAAAVGGGDFYQSFGVYGYVFEGNGDWADNQASAQLYMSGKVTQGTDVWTTASTHFWPGSRYSMKFFAYAPHDIPSATVSTPGNQPSIAYTVPRDVTKQVDLLVADDVETVSATGGSGAEYAGTVAGDYGKPAKLHFYHALTAIKVKAVGELTGTITKVELKGVKGAGTHSFGSDSWELTGDDATFSQTLDVAVGTDPDTETMVIGGATTFMMIPQTLGENAALEITFSDGTVLTGSLSGREWPMGKTVVYRISKTEISEEYFFTVTFDNTNVPTAGDTRKYQVTSYLKRIANGKETIKAVRWEITGYQEEESNEWTSDAPAWLSFPNTAGNGVTTETGSENGNVTVSKEEGRLVFEHNENLKAATPVSGTYNLSNATGAEEVQRTANCYVINAPGTYSLPLVYGNAIDMERNTTRPYYNENAYYADLDESATLDEFLNHTGEAITDPYIYNNEDKNGDPLLPGSAKLIWQDAENLVTDVNLSSDNHSLIFTVNQETIMQGNAVVAVCDASGDVMWSWHIWVTDYKLGEDLKTVTYKSTDYAMLPYNLGWCDGGITYFDGRSVKVRFTQEESAGQREITIRQESGIAYDRGNQPFYQWGRKDPMLPMIDGSENKTWYDASGNTHSELTTDYWSTGDKNITNGILNPGTYCINNNMDAKYYNLWAVDNDGTLDELDTSVKSVYDPCPVGYKVPLQNVFKAFTTANNGTGIKGTWNEDIVGYDFECSDGTVFFPATNSRDQNGSMNTSGSKSGYYWSAVPFSKTRGYRMLFNNDYVSLNNRIRCDGQAVRPVLE